jgi:hypothetical protein
MSWAGKDAGRTKKPGNISKFLIELRHLELRNLHGNQDSKVNP